MGNTSDAGVPKLPQLDNLAFRVLRNGKKYPIFTDPDPDRPRTTALKCEGEVDFSIESSTKIELDDVCLDNNPLVDSIRPCCVVLDDCMSLTRSEKPLKPLILCPEKTHSASSRRSDDSQYLDSVNQKTPIVWPKSSDLDAWESLDCAVYSRLLASKPSLQERVNLLEEVIYEQASILFGLKAVPETRIRGKSRRASHSIYLVKKKNSLIAELNNTLNNLARSSLLEQLKTVKEKIKHLRKGERNRKKRWKRKKALSSFSKNPYFAGKEILNPRCPSSLNISKPEMDDFKRTNLSDPFYSEPLPNLEGLPPNPSLKKKFDDSSLKFGDFQKILASRRSGSSPGLNQIPYKVYKHCPQISSFLFNIFTSCMKHSFPCSVEGCM